MLLRRKEGLAAFVVTMRACPRRPPFLVDSPNAQRSPFDMQRVPCNMRHATCDTQPSTFKKTFGEELVLTTSFPRRELAARDESCRSRTLSSMGLVPSARLVATDIDTLASEKVSGGVSRLSVLRWSCSIYSYQLIWYGVGMKALGSKHGIGSVFVCRHEEGLGFLLMRDG